MWQLPEDGGYWSRMITTLSSNLGASAVTPCVGVHISSWDDTKCVVPSLWFFFCPQKAAALQANKLVGPSEMQDTQPLTLSAHKRPHAPSSHSPRRPPTHPTLTHFVLVTLTLLLKKLCSMGMLICWQWFLLQWVTDAVLFNPNSPGTKKILSQALTAVMLQHSFFNNFPSHPLAHPLCTSLPLLSRFPNLYSPATSLSNLIHSPSFQALSPYIFVFIIGLIPFFLSSCSRYSLPYVIPPEIYCTVLCACIIHRDRLMHFIPKETCFATDLPKCILAGAMICDVTWRILCMPAQTGVYQETCKRNEHLTCALAHAAHTSFVTADFTPKLQMSFCF